ncbi:MAG: dihydroneopterin aldolase [Candidatus Hydrogenedentes bacterium]|nr:dihydroneopterin aldolase [Candidatus Hydrogenedentota bacterium]
MADAAPDRIYIRDLACRCIVGINPDERRNKQDVIINIVLHADLRTPGKTDRIEDTVDYKSVKKDVIRMVETSSFYLLERLANAIAEICLVPPGVERVRVSVDKPGALRFARSVAVEITRERPADD